MTGAKIQARNVLCILHDSPEVIRQLCEEFHSFEYDTDYSGQGSDERMLQAYIYSDDTVRPSLKESDKAAIAEHQNVAYVLSPRLNPTEGIEAARRCLAFVDRCFASGARAVKSESSGYTHGKERWQELAQRQDDASLFWTWVRRPLDDSGVFYSCGFHLLGLPDIEVEDEDALTALELIDLFAMYVLVDKPGDRLRAGITFSLSADAPSYHVRSTKCLRYEEDDFFFNPNGYWHLKRV